jgi:predicted CXXCH cytochrome family protein
MRYSKLSKLGVALVMLCFARWSNAQSVVSIVGSPHDLNHVLGVPVVNAGSSGGTSEVCRPCHTPHQAPYGSGTLLWNHQVDLTKSYTMYTVVNPASNSQSANPILDTTSRLCLSCHDGAIAIDSYGRNNDGTLNQNGGTKIGTITTHQGWTGGFALAGAAGNDLSADHPVGIGYPGLVSSGGVLTFTAGTPNAFNNPLTGANFLSGGVAGGPGVKLVGLPDGRVGVGCTSCHEPHDKSQYFQRMNNNSSALCLTCHIK